MGIHSATSKMDDDDVDYNCEGSSWLANMKRMHENVNVFLDLY